MITITRKDVEESGKMDVKKIIRYFYIGYTLYMIMVINTTNLRFFMILPSFLVMWINYFIFSLGYKVKKEKHETELDPKLLDSWLINRKKSLLFLIASFSIMFSTAAVKYYTGQTPVTVFKNLFSNISLYYEYQTYFAQQQRNIFSLRKLPFVLMLFYVKFILFYSYISFIIIKDKTTKFEKFYLGIITISYIYIGIARGTNFEFFELVMIIIFSILYKFKVKRIKIRLKTLIVIPILVILMIYIFYWGLTRRGIIFKYYISRDVFYNPNGLIPLLFPFLSFVTLLIYGYFGFGFFYMSKFITEVWFSSFENFIAGILPLGFYATEQTSITTIMKKVVDIGARWHPDTALFIGNFGYLGLLLLCFLMGASCKYFIKFRSSSSCFINYIILMQMISLPVGNFISTSSSNKLIVVSLITYWIWKLYVSKIKTIKYNYNLTIK